MTIEHGVKVCVTLHMHIGLVTSVSLSERGITQPLPAWQCYHTNLD